MSSGCAGWATVNGSDPSTSWAERITSDAAESAITWRTSSARMWAFTGAGIAPALDAASDSSSIS
jgi:hypothetical protein